MISIIGVRPWLAIGIQALALFASFVAGSITGYIGLRKDDAALDARVTIEDDRISTLEQSIADWRTEDREFARDMNGQIKDLNDLLTDLRIQSGPMKPKRR